MPDDDNQVNTLNDIRKRVAGIAAGAKADPYGVGADHESLHGDEDELWSDVLAAIAAGRVEPREAARLALETGDISFTRWYA